jgi:membrane carboxypeptidase/penicillin-binding protein
MIRAPNRDNPDERSKIARERRDAVLGVMAAKKWIDGAERDAAMKAPAEFDPGSRRPRPHPYLVSAVRQEFIERIGERKLRLGGLRIRTSVDQTMQSAAERAVRTGTQRLRAGHSWLRRKKPLQGALLSIEPSSGGIRALVGGANFRTSQYDRTRQMQRQPGSAAKPFTYAAAIAERRITPSSIIEDAPIEITMARNNVWKPRNYDDRFRGQVTVRDAFEKSLNVPAIRVASNIGAGRVQEMLQDAGIEGDLSDTPAIALGVDEVSMRELVEAYSIFPNLGMRASPYLIERVDDRDGDEIYEHEPERNEALDPAVSYVMHSLMRGVVMRGTAVRLNQYGLGYVAGKTGTTSNYRDAWFVGYVPDLLTAVWVGFDDGTPLRISSGEAAIPTWAEFMKRVEHSKSDIAPPAGVSIVEVEAATGRLWHSGCGPSVTEVFLAGSEPSAQCGGYWDGQLLIGYEEPAFISEEQWAAWAREMAGLQELQPIETPIDTSMIEADDTVGLYDDIDSTAVDSPVVQPPIVIPPVVNPPVDSGRTAPPPAPPPPPAPVDSLGPPKS